MKKHLDHFLTSLIDWIFRKRSPGMLLIRLGGTVLLALLGFSYALDVKVPTTYGDLKVSLNFNQGTSEAVVLVSLLVVIAVIIFGVILLFCESRENSRKQIVAIELRGLRDTSGSPLKDHIPKIFTGRRTQLLINIRRSDGRILDPEDAVKQISLLPSQLSALEAGLDRSDITYFSGALAPVPFSFLMGVLLDDENKFLTLDWDRDQALWRSLDAEDDNDRFTISGLDKIGSAKEIVLSISISYYTDKQAISQRFPGFPLVSMELTKVTTDNHWSQDKQMELSKEFFSLCRSLSGTSVKLVNLVLDAPNSLVIEMGRKYDKRNLPSLVVWQYENGKPNPYPWGVSMPVAGSQTAKVVN